MLFIAARTKLFKYHIFFLVLGSDESSFLVYDEAARCRIPSLNLLIPPPPPRLVSRLRRSSRGLLHTLTAQTLAQTFFSPHEVMSVTAEGGSHRDIKGQDACADNLTIIKPSRLCLLIQYLLVFRVGF